ncbi:MAG: GGDEF domain-containing protein [Clostridiaceae bacterium]|nr:GGDEF domain-containing protein [Clostridiaceae bacterium]
MKQPDQVERVDRQVSLMLLAILMICFILSAFITRFVFLKYAQEQFASSAQSIFDHVSSLNLQELLVRDGFYIRDPYIMSPEIDLLLASAIELSPAQRVYLVKTSPNLKASYFTGSSDTEAADNDYSYAVELINKAALNMKPVSTPTAIKSDSQHIFGFYFPLDAQNFNIKSIVAIEFSAAKYMRSITASFIIHIMFMIIIWVSAALWAHSKFKAISNLGYKSVYNVDRMTGFKNRNAFDIDLYNINSTRGYEALTIYYIDLNDLKQVNDSKGHEVGDQYLIAMSRLITESMGAGDVIYRVGGDEFCVLSFNHVRSKARAAIARFELAISKYNEANGTDYSAAIGFAVFNFDVDADASATRARAEMRMYENKKRMKSGLEQLAEEGNYVPDLIN